MSMICRCQSCHDPICDPNEVHRLPCAAVVCEACYDWDFWSGTDCPQEEPGRAAVCRDCTFSLVESEPEILTYSDADPGL